MAALAGWVYAYGLPFSWVALGATGVLTAVCAAFRRLPMDFGKNTVAMVDVAVLAALVFLGPIWALLVAAPSILYKDRLRTTYEAASYAAILLAGGWVFRLFAEPLLFSPRFDLSLVYAVVAASAAYHTLDVLINSGLLRVKYGTSFSELLRDVVLAPVPSDVISALAVLGASYTMVAYGPLVPLALFCGAAGAVISLHLVRERREMVGALRAEVEALKSENAHVLASPLSFAVRLVEGLELRDGRTARHAAASATYAVDLARELGLEPIRTEKVRVAALLQNVGLASVPDEALLAPPKRLNSVGRMQVEEHPVRSERMLAGIPGFEEAASWVRWHHERVDGTGYPDRLRDEWIPLEAKILAVAGHYASLILDGPSKPGLSPQEARRELVGSIGQALDAGVARVFLRILDTEDENYATAADNRFVLPASAGSPSRRDLPFAGGAVGHFSPTGTAGEAR